MYLRTCVCAVYVGEDEFQIITGPNMGGKSTYIRQVSFSLLRLFDYHFVGCGN